MSMEAWVRCGLVLSLAATSAVTGCSGSGDDDDESTIGTGGSGASGGGGTGGASGGTGAGTSGGTASDTAACGNCATGEGCLVVHITRSEDTSTQPWLLWPDLADGIGTLVVSVTQGGTIGVTRVTGADMTPAAAAYEASLCAAAGSARLMAFLDDDEDAEELANFSGDYVDFCAFDRQPTITVPAATTVTVPYVLNNSCD